MLFKPFDYIGEIWLPITENEVEGVKENYYIVSNYGFVSNIYYNEHHKVYSPNYLGQFNNRAYINLTLKDGSGKLVILARIVAKKFCPGYAPNLEVNHKDGDPTNNIWTNLEWTTRSENIRHAYDNNLIESLITEDMVRQICYLLQEDKKSAEEIAIITGLNNISTNPISLISAIKKKKVWVHISKDYKFPSGRHGRLFTDEQVEEICKLIDKNPSITNKEIINYFGFDIHSCSNKYKYNNVLNSIRCGRSYSNISYKYSFI